jgi:hypothetical protein
MPHFQTLGYEPSHSLIPHVTEATTTFPAGPLVLGVEERSLQEVNLDVGGPTVHVFSAADGEAHLRFDLFADGPHYHYIATGGVQRVVVFDEAANGDMADWTLNCLRNRLPAMLQLCGEEELASRVNQDAVDAALPAVEKLMRASYHRVHSVVDWSEQRPT